VIWLVGLTKKSVVGGELRATGWAWGWASSFPSTPGTCGFRDAGEIEDNLNFDCAKALT
jgi:hypothetical protein